MNTTLKTTLSLAAVLVCFGAFAPAALADGGSRYAHVERVQTNDIDVTSAASLQVLYARVKKAAYRVCRADGPSTGTIAFTQCRQNLVEAVVQDANIPALTALHNNPAASGTLSASR